MFHLIVWDESDGNDCTVFDTVVEAPTADDACSQLADALEKAMTENGTGYQEDGNMLGYYFDCDCDEANADTCDGHGGISLRTVESYTTEDDARAAMSKWHREYSV